MARNSDFFLGENLSTIIKLGNKDIKICLGSKLLYQPRIDISSATVSVGAKTYNGSSQVASSITISVSGVTLVQGADYQITANSGGTNVGNYTVTVIGLGLYKGTTSGTFTINKVTPTVTAPTAKVLTYNETAQVLANEGSTNYGTIQYSLDNSTWSTSIPTATNYGNYPLYYRVVGDSNVNDVASQSINCSISEKKVTATVTLSQSTYTYSGSAFTPTVTVKDGTTVIPASEYTVTYSNNINAGTATVTITDNVGGNYDVIGSATFTINKANGVAGVSNRTLSYSRGTQNLVAVNGNTGTVYYRLGTDGSWTNTIPTATNAGTYTVYYYIAESANYKGVNSSSSPGNVSTTISKVTPVLSTSPSLRTGLTYNGSAQNLLSGGAMKHSSSDATAVSGTFTYIQQTTAGTYNNPTWSFTPSDTTNYNSASGTISGSVTIAKATGTATVTNTATSYNGSAKNLVAVSNTTGTMHYRLRTDGSWTTNIPTATNAGNYDVYWYMDASTNYNGLNSSSSPAKVACTIAKIDPTITAPTAKTGLTYNGSAQTLWNSGSNTTAGTFNYSTGTNAGSYTATWSFTPTDTTNYNSKNGSASVSIAKAAGSISYGTTSVSKTYGNGVFTNTLTKSGDGSVTYSSSATGVATVNSSGQVTIIGAGSATITATVTDGTNYTYATKTTSYTLSVAKATPTVTAPTAKSLTYSGAAQTLINAGSTTGGTIQYKLGTGSYSTSLPSATTKGSYTVYYKVVGNSNYNDVSESSVACSIGAKALTITAKAQTINYGTAITQGVAQVTTSGLVSNDSLTAITLTQSTSNVTTSGTITPSAGATTNGIGNYSVTYNTGTLTINAVAATVTTAPSAKSLTYSGSAQALVNAGSANGGTMYYQMTTSNSKPSNTSSFSTTIPTGTNAGTYYVWYYVKADSNHTDSAISSSAVSVSIANKSISISAPTGVSRAYNGSAATATFASVTGASITKYRYSTNNSSWTESATNPSQTNAGTLYTQAYYTAGTNYTGSGWSSSATLTISKADQPAPTVSVTAATYPGTSTATATSGGGQGPIEWYNGSSRSSVGTQTTKARWSGNSNYNASSYSNEVTLSVSKFTPTVTLAATDRAYNGNALYATASIATPRGGATMKGTIYYGTTSGAKTYNVAYNGSGSVNLSSVSITNVGSATVYAYFVPDSTCNRVYNNSGNASKTFTISKANQNPPTSISGSSVTYPATATASASGGGGQGSIEWYNGNSRSAIGSQNTKARWSGNGNYNASSYSSEVTLSVSKFTPTVSLASTNRAYNGGALYATASVATPSGGATMKGTIYYGTSAGAQTYSVTYGGSGSVNLSSVSITNVGSATVYAYFVPDSSCNRVYNNSGNASRTFTISKANQSAPTATGASTTYPTTATASASGGGGQGTLTWTNGSSRSGTSVGSQTTKAYWAGNGNYNASGYSNEVTLSVSKATPTVTISVTNRAYNGSALYATASVSAPSGGASPKGTIYYGTSSGATTYSVYYGGSGSVNLSSVSVTNVGSATVYAYFAPDSSCNGVYNNSGSVGKTFSVTKASQSAPSASGASVTYPNTATASASGGGGQGSLTWTNGNSRSAIGSQNTQAYWSGNGNYNASGYSSAVTLTVSKATPTVNLAATNRAYNGGALYATASVSVPSGGTAPKGTIYYGTSSGATTYSVSYGGSGSVNLSSVSVTNVGSATVYAYFVPNSTCNGVYNNSGNASKTFTISKANQSAPTASVTAATYPGTSTASASGGGGVGTLTWTNGSSRSSVGTQSTAAYWAGNGNYNASPNSNSVTLSVSKATPTITLSVSNRVYNGGALYATASVSAPSGGAAPKGTIYYGTSAGATTYSVSYSGSGSVNLSSVSVTNVGSATVYAYFAPDSSCNGVYNNSGNAGKTFSVTRANISPSVSMGNWVYGETAANPSVSGNSGGGSVTYHYKVYGAADSTYTTTKPSDIGTYTVRATIAQSTNYNGNTATANFSILTNFKPSGSDALITSDGKYFNRKI